MLLFHLSTECTHSYREAPGNISELISENQPTYNLCRYHVVAPLGHYIRLNVTGLVGVPRVSECLPKIVIKYNELGKTKKERICYLERTLPFVVQSNDNEITIVFRSSSQVQQNSSFNATFTFHKTGEFYYLFQVSYFS